VISSSTKDNITDRTQHSTHQWTSRTRILLGSAQGKITLWQIFKYINILFVKRSYAAPCAMFYWVTLHLTELIHTQLSYTAPWWVTLHSAELSPPHPPPTLSYAAPFWTTRHLLRNGAPYWATGCSTLHLTELHYTHWAGLLPIAVLACLWLWLISIILNMCFVLNIF